MSESAFGVFDAHHARRAALSLDRVDTVPVYAGRTTKTTPVPIITSARF
jgi:hypothetical protein